MKMIFRILFVLVALGAAHGGATEVIYDRASADIFPESWVESKIGAKAELLSREEATRCREIMPKALRLYPAAVLNSQLKKVYVLGGLEYSGVPTGGTNSRSVVYLVSKPRYSAAEIEKIFHAEFSSILLRNFPDHLDQAAWLKINPADFSYRGSGVKAIQKRQASQRVADGSHADGFLHEYAKASLEEDFNSFAGRLFMGDAGLWLAIEASPKLKAKADLVVALYGKLDAGFTWGSFGPCGRAGRGECC